MSKLNTYFLLAIYIFVYVGSERRVRERLNIWMTGIRTLLSSIQYKRPAVSATSSAVYHSSYNPHVQNSVRGSQILKDSTRANKSLSTVTGSI